MVSMNRQITNKKKQTNNKQETNKSERVHYLFLGSSFHISGLKQCTRKRAVFCLIYESSLAQCPAHMQ